MATRLKMKAKRSGKGDEKNDKSVDECDTAILTKPLATSINNLLKIIQLYKSTTDEIRQYLTSECEILYECRVCRSIFRSLSNLILHKRKYCQDKFSHVTNTKWFKNDDDYLEIIQKETCNTTESNKDEIKLPKKNLNSIIDSLSQKKQTDLEIESLLSSEQKENQEIDNIKHKSLELEIIEGSNCGMYQTLNTQDILRSREEKTKLEILEMHRLTEGQTAILGPDGKVINQRPVSGLKILDENTSLTCPKCNVNFSTRKTLLSHIKYKHESERIVYPCLECSETFATVWSVYRHLYNIHHKTISEVRKMRSRIKPKSVRNEEVSADKNDQSNIDLNDQQKIDEENQAWMDNFESDNDIQMCGGCGRRFERKAALNSHSQTCQKRINARNIINANKQKRSAALEEKSADKKTPKIIRLDPEAEKKFLDKQKMNVAKKRKIGIQIRYDYTKASDKNVPVVSNSNTPEDTDSSNKSFVNNSQKNIQSADEKAHSQPDQIKSDFNSEADMLDSEVVSIPSSNSSPNKEEDPLALKDVQSDSDCEIQEILGPIDHSIFGNRPSTVFNFETKDGGSDIEEETEPYKITNINENTLKLIKLINSDVPQENFKPTLDEKMANFVNMRKLKCIPCDIKFGNISKLRHHMASHFNWNRFRCDICSFKAYDKIDVFEHIKRDHNIIDFEKIEAVILQIPDWETTEMSSDVFIARKELDIFPVSKTSAEEKKRDREISSGSESPDNCIVIESNESAEKQIAKQIPRPKRKIKVAKVNRNESEHVTADTRDPLADSPPEETRSESRLSNRSNQDPALKKMVYEVIFGQDVTITKTSSVSSSASSEEKDSLHVVPTDVSSVISRPVRNRVKPLNKDFIYDLHDFKEHHKTVLVSNNNRKTTPLANTVSESLEDLHSSKKTNKIRIKKLKKINERSFGNMDNIDKNLNLQKRAIESFADNQILAGHGGFPQNISVVESKAITDNNSTQLSDEDDDIYIIENEELVAVK